MTDLTEQLDEHRNRERVSTRRPAQIFINDDVFDALIINLSLEGLGILIDRELSENTPIKILFSLPGYEQSSTLTLNGNIVHRTEVNQKCLFGVRFALLSLHEKLVITGYINYHHRLD
ncbi:MAG: PilZ domain-containing protein [Thiotrichales bacterium]|nr:PilZ domain-containing protein [Thiotrichales bacterium]